MTETQETVGKWADDTFGPGDRQSPARALRVLDECLELCVAAGASAREVHALVARKLRRKLWQKGVRDHEALPHEIADVQITIWGFAHQQGVDLPVLVGEKMKVNRGRCWKVNGDGTGQHHGPEKK